MQRVGEFPNPQTLATDVAQLHWLLVVDPTQKLWLIPLEGFETFERCFDVKLRLRVVPK